MYRCSKRAMALSNFPTRVVVKLDVFHGTVPRGKEAVFESFEDLRKYLGVIVSLDVGPMNRSSLYSESIRRLLHSSMPLLSELTVKVVYDTHEELVAVPELDLKAANLPKLEVVTLHGVLPPHSDTVLRQLKRLTLSSYPSTRTLLPPQQLVTMLEKCVRLERLNMTRTLEVYAMKKARHGFLAEVPKLTVIEVEDDSENIAHLLLCLHLPSLRAAVFEDNAHADTSHRPKFQSLLPPSPHALDFLPWPVANVIIHVSAAEACIRALSSDSANICLRTKVPRDDDGVRRRPRIDLDGLFIDAINTLATVFSSPTGRSPAKVWMVGNLNAVANRPARTSGIDWADLLASLGGTVTLRVRDTKRGMPPDGLVEALTPEVCPCLSHLEISTVRHDKTFLDELACALEARNDAGLPRLTELSFEFVESSKPDSSDGDDDSDIESWLEGYADCVHTSYIST